MLGIRVLLLLGGLLVWWPLLIVWLVLTILPHTSTREFVIVESPAIEPPGESPESDLRLVEALWFVFLPVLIGIVVVWLTVGRAP